MIRFWTPAVLFFAVWGGLSVRNSCYFGFIVVPFLADCIHSYPEIFKRVSNILPLLAVVPLFIYGHLLAAPLPKSYIRPSFFPDAACQFVIENNIQGPLFNSYGFGGYLEWRLGPNRPVFMDGRYPFMKFMEEQRSFFKGAVEDTVDRWREYFQRYKINFAITNYPAYIPEGPFAELSPLNMMFPRSDWALVYWDDAALVFLFRNKINAALIAKFEYKLSRPYNRLQLERLLQAQVISPKDLEGEIDRHVKETGPSQRGERMRYLLRSLSSGQPAG